MVYNIKKDNYKTFETYKENVLLPRAYFIPFRTLDALEKTDFLTERYNSDSVQVLSGEWDFRYFAHVSEIPDSFDTATAAFDRVPVPSCWQFTGYEPPFYVNCLYQFDPDPPHIPEDCSVGVYRRFFTVENSALHYTLSFLGVAGSLDVFVNGRYVGYSEGSHNTAEFELDEFLAEGENELVAVVHKYCNGSYLECQDMFRNNGIFRDVLLTETGDNSIYDFEIRTAYRNGKYDLEILPSLKLTDSCVLTAALMENGISKSVDVGPDGIDKITFTGLEVDEWSAEIPNLYTLLLTLSKDGEAVQVIRRFVGFKHIEIRGNVFYFNNEKIKLLGVNHHDTDPKKGYVMTAEDMARDVRIFKEYNVNCVRTSHYPPDPMFLDLCDFYGVYTIDEADIETHGCEAELHKPGACSHRKAWGGHYWDRVYRMFARDKNHVCITMWSLGNEAWGYRNQDLCYENLKKLTDIPIHYEGVVRTRRFAYDVISQMYPWQPKMKKLADGKGLSAKWYEKPYFLCEYAHAMGVGAGELETYVQDFLRADNMMGGCIWEFCDHAVYHENGKYRYTYGGDHGEAKHDKNFCVDGLFYPDRTPHAGALQMKNCYRPVRASLTDFGHFTFKNLLYFRPLQVTVNWEAFNRCGKLGSGSFTLCLAPQAKTGIVLDIEEDCETVVFRYMLNGTEIAAEQLTFGDYQHLQTMSAVASTALITAVFREGDVQLRCGDDVLLLGASLYRAPLDNDMYLRKVWDKMALATERLTLKSVAYDAAEYTLSTDAVKKMAALSISKHDNENGGLWLCLKCTNAKLIPFLPRFGMTLILPKKYSNVRYFGLGERQNLPDFQEHAMPGEYAMTVDEMREKYIKPQESSQRCGVVWAEVTDDDGHGYRFEMDDVPFIFGADHFTSRQCAEAMHQEDLILQDFTCVHLDGYQLGAASGACGPMPTKAFRKNSAKDCCIRITVKAI